MTTAWVPLATVTLASTDSEIVFSSIPATYRDLVLVTNFAESAVTGNIELRYNSDTGSNYSQVFMAGRQYNSSTESSSGTFSLHYLNLGSRPSGARSVNVLQIMDYSDTSKHKTTLGRVNNGTSDVQAYAYRWANTSAINTISIKPSATTFTTGSTFSLYGSNKL
jgi:hypothetical protein